MPPTRTKKLLEDIRDAAQFIVEVAHGKSLRDFTEDRVIRNAIERNFEIIGEAIRRLADSDPPVVQQISDYRRIIDFRNVLIHGYDLVDFELVWQTVHEKLPALLLEVGELLQQE